MHLQKLKNNVDTTKCLMSTYGYTYIHCFNIFPSTFIYNTCTHILYANFYYAILLNISNT